MAEEIKTPLVTKIPSVSEVNQKPVVTEENKNQSGGEITIETGPKAGWKIVNGQEVPPATETTAQ